ncbi:MAG: hypothetical protein OEU44_08670 [Gammaproteobacteria bacterium]|nr:hypothetical protein [Gammaproteobacteria bacterium]
MAGVLVLGVLLVLYLYRHRTRGIPAAGAVSAAGTAAAVRQAEQPVNALVDALRQACESNDAHSAARALLQWAAVHWPEGPPTSLGALAQRVSSGTAAVRELDQALYAPGKQSWQGQALWQAFQKGLDDKQEHSQAGSEALSPLYPDWDRK